MFESFKLNEYDIDLPPCPFCGGAAEVGAGRGYPGEKITLCTQCGVTMEEHYAEDETYKCSSQRWRERVKPKIEGFPEGVDPIEALRRAIKGTPAPIRAAKWVGVKYLLGYGSTISKALCRWAGSDPESRLT